MDDEGLHKVEGPEKRFGELVEQVKAKGAETGAGGASRHRHSESALTVDGGATSTGSVSREMVC